MNRTDNAWRYRVKPRLRRLPHGVWNCTGGGVGGFGLTPAVAYGQWLANRDRQVWVPAGVPFVYTGHAA